MERVEFQAAPQQPAVQFTAAGEVASHSNPVPLAKADVLTACALATCGEAPSTVPLGSLRVTWRRPS